MISISDSSALSSEPCNQCPRRCNVLRAGTVPDKRSLCGATDTPEVALVSLHLWEEPCLSGEKGAGTVFFSHCNLRCCFCQNHEISAEGKGTAVSIERLTQIFLEQQARGATCLELVTPTHYSRSIRDALIRAKECGLTIPVAFNTNGYDLPETLKTFEGLADIFLPDLKYWDSRLGKKYSGVPHYRETACEAIRTMVEMTGPAVFDEKGLLKRGVIVRHLVLPGLWKDSINCVDWLYDTFGNNIYLSLMNQYMPLYKACRHPEINRPLMTLEYQKVVRYARSRGITQAFIQVGKTADSKFIPVFDGSGV